uniref:DH domain-containing protein n=1 Tax=Angiostrongylus cantonensis TaxID=6313 RepID=A0A158P9N9_ANGCA
MASNAAASSGAVESRRTFGKYISCGCSASEMPSHLGNRPDLDYSMLKNDMAEAVVKIDPVLEQIERNRRIAELLSPVLKYKIFLRTFRKFSLPGDDEEMSVACCSSAQVLHRPGLSESESLEDDGAVERVPHFYAVLLQHGRVTNCCLKKSSLRKK